METFTQRQGRTSAPATVPTAPNTTYSFGYVASFDAISTNVAPDPAPGNTLTFGGQLVGSTSTGQSVALTNSGTLPSAIGSIAASGDYAQTNTCGSSVNVQKSCQITVTFTPTAAGNQSGILTIADGAASSPQTLNLSGTGQDFTLGMASSASSTATVTAGQTATYSLTLSPLGGTNQTMTSPAPAPPPAPPAPSIPLRQRRAEPVRFPLPSRLPPQHALLPCPLTPVCGRGEPMCRPSKGITLLLLGLLISVSIVIGLPDMKPEKNRLRFRLGIGALVAFALVMAACWRREERRRWRDSPRHRNLHRNLHSDRYGGFRVAAQHDAYADGELASRCDLSRQVFTAAEKSRAREIGVRN